MFDEYLIVTPTPLIVPRGEEDAARSLGAVWRDVLQGFVVENSSPFGLMCFQPWLPSIIGRHFYVLSGMCGCWKCGFQTLCYALGVGDCWDVDTTFFDKPDGSESEEVEITPSTSPLVLSNVKFLPHVVADVMRTRYATYKPAFSKTKGATYWANHCAACGVIQGDWFLHDEPGSLFNPLEQKHLARITATKEKHPFYTKGIDRAWASWLSDVEGFAG